MEVDILKKHGFVELQHEIFPNLFVLSVGRYRKIKIASLNTTNEVVFISQLDYNERKEDLVCLHNFDYDGYFTEEKLANLLSLFK